MAQDDDGNESEYTRGEPSDRWLAITRSGAPLLVFTAFLKSDLD
jgi:hypothetical protein